MKRRIIEIDDNKCNGCGACAAAVAFILIDFNDPSFHVQSSCCFCALIVLY